MPTLNSGQDYVNRIHEEVAALERELQGDVPARLTRIAQTLGIPDHLALAAVYRAARRSGLTIEQFENDVEQVLFSRVPSNGARE
ncbi:MAG TPA: hypothetical protein VKY56_09780 [Chloroflexota bacterium]|nr:hypothetical protein [Chloroflexota bacterium]